MDRAGGCASSTAPVTRAGRASGWWPTLAGMEHGNGGTDSWRALGTAARRDYGAVTRARAVQAGVPPSTVSRWAQAMDWGRPHRGVYTLPGTGGGLRRDAAAALLAVGSRALLTGDAALFLYGVLQHRPSTIDLVVPASARPAARARVRLIRTRAYDDIRWRLIDGLRVVHPTRALADVSPSRTGTQLARHIARAVALRRCSLEHAARELEVRARFPGRGSYSRAIRMLRGELTHSADERRARTQLKAVGLSPFPRPYPIVVDGAFVAEADIAILEVLYDVEVDGPHHDLPEQVQADKARDRRLGRASWTVDRFPVEFVSANPNAFAREVLARVRQLRARRP